MSRDFKTFFIRFAALGAAACSSVYAVSSSPGDDAVAEARPAARSPFTVELVGEDGRVLETYSNRGRSYVLGMHGDRYSIRVKNPTGRRVEAVISVDGLDVIDGENADFTGKRGYVVPAHGELVVDGFRTSTTQVAAFRFSSVADSYAERKGKGRNIGVIGVAIFNEKEDPQLIMPQETARDRRFDDDLGGDAEESGGRFDGRGAPSADRAPAESAPSGTATGGGAKAGSAPARPAPAPPRTRTATRDEGERRNTETCCGPQKKQRPGLGTQFGEQRWSAVDFTRFVRANAKVPVAMAELRYNDAEGLRALGIRLQPTPDEDELMRRETADPFPSSHGFASPPPQ
ncbi:MAG TPA: hypothetical protein VFU21_24020 [Kofleriaceae bacterium]|nr:hypothetical protein [Kofleriaceae bacterium]